MWTSHFGYDTFPTKKTILIFVFFKNGLESPLILFFLRENKIRNKIINVTHNMEKRVSEKLSLGLEIRLLIEKVWGQVVTLLLALKVWVSNNQVKANMTTNESI